MAKTNSSRNRLFKIVIIAIILPFVYPFGHPFLSLNDLNFNILKQRLSVKEGAATADLSMNEAQLDNSVVVYRWRDGNGGWSFGSNPPADGTPYKALTIQSDANLIQGIKQEKVNGADNEAIVLPDGDDKPVSMMGYSAEDLGKIMQSAKDARAAMENRYQQQQAIIDSQ